ncbi:MAG: DNA-binding protein WhiA [Ruminococcaceae bacterium]|nr:DNA-binding protein WhiA [Oscillospiraceae bacterium]
MSFSYEVKETIMKTKYKSPCCRRALFQGILTSKGYTSDTTVYINLENMDMIEYVGGLIKEFFGKDITASSLPTGGRGKRLSFLGKAQAAFLLALDKQKNPYQKKCPYCTSAFLRGVFFACGRISDPNKQFCLEFSLGNRLELLSEEFDSLGFEFKSVTRKNERILYTKNSAVIEDFFAAAELNDVAYAVMNKKIENEFMNNANRIRNFDTVNISKAVDAANPQYLLIKKLVDNDLFVFLPKELHETAKLRLNNPDMSLSQLAIHSTSHISKSGITHRMARIMKIGKEILSKNNL